MCLVLLSIENQERTVRVITSVSFVCYTRSKWGEWFVCASEITIEAGKDEQKDFEQYVYIAKWVSGSEIHARISAMYGKNITSRTLLFKWNKRFREGQMLLKDSSKPGESRFVTTPSVTSAMEVEVKTDRRRPYFWSPGERLITWPTIRLKLWGASLDTIMVTQATANFLPPRHWPSCLTVG